MEGTVVSLNVSETKGSKKRPVESVTVTESGIEGDAHSGDWHRQVSLLADESVDGMRSVYPEISPGDFAENITTQGIDLRTISIGARLSVGDAVLEVTQIGKECHTGCDIRDKVGDCIMPREGIFARVVGPGMIRVGDNIKILSG